MLKLALRAQIPFISVVCRDLPNAYTIVKRCAMVPSHVKQVKLGMPTLQKGYTYVAVGHVSLGEDVDFPKLYKQFQGMECSLVMVLPEETELAPEWFNAGLLPVPVAMIRKKLDELGVKHDVLEALGGLTLIEVEQIIRLCYAEFDECDRALVARTRKKVIPVHDGLQQVDVDLVGYVRDSQLEHWCDTQAPFFFKDCDARLKPRGLLLMGPPGTGKTMGAMRLADRMGLPLFRYEPAAVKSKYVGESEKALVRTLQQVDIESPCVFLIDEVEKLFAQSNDAGVTDNLLGGLLWWLQYRTSRVLVVMTTNNVNRIPEELIRPPRISKHLQFSGLDREDAMSFADTVLKSYIHASIGDTPGDRALKKMVYGLFGQPNSDSFRQRVAQAHLAEGVTQLVKETMLANGLPLAEDS